MEKNKKYYLTKYPGLFVNPIFGYSPPKILVYGNVG